MNYPTASALALCDFITASPTPYHFVAQAVARLEKAGFKRLRERDSWTRTAAGDAKEGVTELKEGGRYYITRNQSSLIAFTVPSTLPTSAALPLSIVGCHTDSPNFRVRPVSRKEKGGYAQVGVETYGGGLWATWMDRDLSIAGRVTLQSTEASGAGAKQTSFTTHLIQIKRPILRIPTLAIHLGREQNDKFYYNPETQQVPILAMASKALNARPEAADTAPSFADPTDISSFHHPILLHAVADELATELGREVTPAQIADFDLSLYDVQPSCIGGALNEFIFSPRLDNQFSSFCAVEGIIRHATSIDAGEKDDGRVNMIALWDHEEIGSESAVGAQSNFLPSVMERVAHAFAPSGSDKSEAFARTMAASFLLSCDMAHGFHPAFPEKYEENHRPRINGGPAIKFNAKQRYASTSQTSFLLRQVAGLAKGGAVPMQQYEVRNDMACGSTIGPLVSKIGLRTVDIGCPQLSMHSIRETAGAKDVEQLVRLFEVYFARMGEVDDDQVLHVD